MDIHQFHRITDRLEAQLEGEGYYINVRTKSGKLWADYRWSRPLDTSILELSRDDHPPVWLPISNIESIELAGGNGEDSHA